MLTITSNLTKVIGQVQGFQAAVPRAVARALQWEKWISRAREVAEKTLFILAGPEEWDEVRALVKKILAGPLPAGFFLQLNATKDRDTSLFAAQQSLAGMNTVEALNLTGLSPRDFMELLRRWVMTPEEDGGKRRDERDDGRSDDEIVNHLMRVFFAPSGTGIPGSEEGLQAARTGLMPHIVAFYQGEMASASGGRGAKPERIEEWLSAVLTAWRAMVRDEIAARIRAELKAKRFP